MPEKSSKLTIGCPGISTILTIIFVILKLTGKVDWSWIWVLCPLWISVGFSLLVSIIMFVFIGIKANDWNNDRKDW